MQLFRISPFLLLSALLFLQQNEESHGLNLFLSPQQAHAFVVTEDKSSSAGDPLAATTTEEIGIPVRPGEVEKEIQEEFIEDQSAEKYASKSPSTKDYRKVNHQAQKDDDDHDDDDDDDQDKKKNNDDDDDGKAKTLSSWRKREKAKEKKQNGKTNEQRRSSLGEPSDEQISERLLKYSYEPSWFLKIAWALEQFSLSASDLNVVLFFFSLPWLRQFWR